MMGRVEIKNRQLLIKGLVKALSFQKVFTQMNLFP
jgi:hypothetical protein